MCGAQILLHMYTCIHAYIHTYIHAYIHADADGCDPRGVRRVRAGRDRGAGEARHAGWPLQARGLQQGRLSCVCLEGKMYVCMYVCMHLYICVLFM